MYAQVIVDVPTKQTDHTFDYLIPPAWQGLVLPGMRVSVPFGRSGRLVQGFVLAIQEKSAFTGKVKPIVAVFDLKPVLNTELLQLSEWLAQNTFAFRISCLQTMLPNVMRSKTQKLAVSLDPTVTNSSLFNNKPVLALTTQLTPANQKQLILWQQQGLIKIQYLLKNQAHHLTQLVLKRRSLDYEDLLKQLTPRATQQCKLLQLFIDHEQPFFSYRQLQHDYQISNATINAVLKKGWFDKDQVLLRRRPPTLAVQKTSPKQLTAEQKQAVEQVIQRPTQPTLLEGVTGSGKTEVYLQLIQYYLQQGKTALMLVPEIALTPQMVQRVQERFGQKTAVLHSGLSQGERYDEWQRIQDGTAQVVVGARSAVFAPLKNIGIIIIDEEHEASYKQSDNPRYHARDVALWRGKYHHCPVVLGSATPSLESRARGQKKVYNLVRLTKRVHDQPLPPVQIIDLRDSRQLSQYLDLSKPLLQAVQTNLLQHQQTILLLNRRGFAAYLLCRQCGFVANCPNCDISLTVHLKEHRLLCHYCGYQEPIYQSCPQCGSKKLKFDGTGTQKVERELAALWPQARIVRMDNDTTNKKGAHQRLLSEFEQQGDILLGTQMIAKGLDFPNVTLVGVINADTGLATSDFRASERTFQLLTQVSGRAGRAQKAGRVLIQTYNPDHYAIQLAAKQNYEQFYQREMVFRHQAGYPPYFYLIKISISHKSQAAALKMAYNIAKQLKPLLLQREQLLGPTQPAIGRIDNHYYYQIVIKYRKNDALFKKLNQIMNSVQIDHRQGFLVAIDHEPQQLE